MTTKDSFLILVHYKGTIKKKTQSKIKFIDKDSLSVFIRPSISLDRVKYDSFVIGSNNDLQFSEVRISELLAKLVDEVSSSGGSNRNH
ncbi:hypothetical protein Ahy_A09g041406 [Arachis hypogaea]|uniref:Uncharacterized protein n=1 Tax=Arachis hypogaea TaxID=3818 RepID=A0A445BCN3_ARAHY|nr:hypothetical protein Ahy_A09g041406 [Arachis hypogaea]